MKLTLSLFAILVLIVSIQQIEFAFGDEKNINFFLDKPSYEPRDIIQIEGWINNVNSTEIQIEIRNPDRTVVVHQRVLLEEVFEIDHQIGTFGAIWEKPGFYQIKVSHSGDSENKLFAFGNFDPKIFQPEIKLNKERYSWTDTAEITIVSPNDNKNIHQIDKIKIEISSRAGTLSKYTLEETGVSEGVFSGIVTLTGFSDFDLNQDGRPGDVRGYTGGVGPDEGNLAANPNDTLKITYSTPFYDQIVEASAPVQFHKGKVEWIDLPIYPDTNALVRVTDPDMRLLPEIADNIKVLAKSFPQKYSKEFTLRETENNSGVFEGKIHLNSKDKMSGVFVRPGSIVSVQYVDTTVPTGFLVKKLNIIANATVSGIEVEEKPESVPSWVKKTAKWWSAGSIGDDGFLQAIQHLIDKKIIKVTQTSDQNNSPVVPHWLKRSAGWWEQGKISDQEFVEEIKHLLEHGIIVMRNV